MQKVTDEFLWFLKWIYVETVDNRLDNKSDPKPLIRKNQVSATPLVFRVVLRGGTIILRVGVQILLAVKPAEKFWWLYFHIWHSGCTTAAKRHRPTESLSDSVTQEYAFTVFLTGHALNIAWPININKYSKWPTKIAQTVGKKNAVQHRKPNTTHYIKGLYRSDGDISDISTLSSLISVPNQSSNDNVKTLYRNSYEACDHLPDGKVSDVRSDSIIPSSFINIIVIIIIS